MHIILCSRVYIKQEQRSDRDEHQQITTEGTYVSTEHRHRSREHPRTTTEGQTQDMSTVGRRRSHDVRVHVRVHDPSEGHHTTESTQNGHTGPAPAEVCTHSVKNR